MGSNRELNIAASGFPGTNDTWRFVQKAWQEPLKALAMLAGNNVILTGVQQIDNQNFIGGYIVYNKVIYPVLNGQGIFTNISLQKDIVSATYDVDMDNNGEQDILPTYMNSYFIPGSGGNGNVVIELSNLKYLKTIATLSDFQLPNDIVTDANYVHTDNNFTNELLQKLQQLQGNVQADWNTSSSALASYIKNKPTNLLQKHAEGWVFVGDLTPSNQDFLVPIPDAGSNNYFVAVSVESSANASTVQDSATHSFVVHGKTNTSFRVRFQEFRGAVQQLWFKYIIIKN